MNAQTEIKKTFKGAKTVAIALLLLLLATYFLSGFYSVKPEQRGVLIRFGKVIDDNVMPGIHYRFPWPIESVERPRTTEVRSLSVRFLDTQNVESKDTTGVLLTGDENLALMTLTFQYTIVSPKDFLFTSTDSEKLLYRLIEEDCINHLAEISIDEAFTTGRQKLQVILKRDLQKRIDELKLGMRITSVQIQSIEPPPSVARAFKDVASAREDKQKAVKEAEGERNRRLPEARAQADQVISKAEGYANELTEMAHGEANRFIATWKEYKKAKSVTAHRLYMDNVEKVLGKVKKLITNPKAEKKVDKNMRFR